MKKFKKVLLAVATFAIAFIAVGLASSNTKAEAARWHNGTPKVLRGKYKTHHYGADLMETIKISRKSVVTWGAGMPVVDGYHVRYKRLGKNRYELKYNTKPSGFYRGDKNVITKIRKVGKKLKITGDSHWYYKY